MKLISMSLLLLGLLIGCTVNNSSSNSSDVAAPTPGTPQQQAEVEKAALSFLDGLDKKTDNGWSSTSPLLKKMTNKVVWSAGISTFRSSVGSFENRELLGFGFTETLDGVPPGDYVAVIYNTKFSNMAVEEKVVLHNDQGRWKILGYFLSKSYKFKL